MSITKTVFCFVFSEIKNQFFFYQLDSLFTFEGPKIECCKLSKSWKNTTVTCTTKFSINVMIISTTRKEI